MSISSSPKAARASRPRAGEGRVEVFRALHHPHPPPAPARRRLDEHRPAGRFRFARKPFRGLIVAVVSRHQRNAGAAEQPLGLALRSHRPDGGGRRADEGDPARFARFGEVGVFGEEAVAGMDRVRSGAPRRVQDRLGVEIALAGRGRADPVRLVRRRDVQGVRVCVRVHGDAPDAEPPCGTTHPAGDLAPVRDEQPPEHPAVLLFHTPAGRAFRDGCVRHAGAGRRRSPRRAPPLRRPAAALEGGRITLAALGRFADSLRDDA